MYLLFTIHIKCKLDIINRIMSKALQFIKFVTFCLSYKCCLQACKLDIIANRTNSTLIYKISVFDLLYIHFV